MLCGDSIKNKIEFVLFSLIAVLLIFFSYREPSSQLNSEFKNNSIDGVYSDLVFLDEKLENPVRNFIAGKYKKKGAWHFPHPTLYLKKEVYDKIGLFDLIIE